MNAKTPQCDFHIERGHLEANPLLTSPAMCVILVVYAGPTHCYCSIRVKPPGCCFFYTKPRAVLSVIPVLSSQRPTHLFPRCTPNPPASPSLGLGTDTRQPDGRTVLPWQADDMMITYFLEGGARLTLRASGVHHQRETYTEPCGVDQLPRDGSGFISSALIRYLVWMELMFFL